MEYSQSEHHPKLPKLLVSVPTLHTLLRSSSSTSFINCIPVLFPATSSLYMLTSRLFIASETYKTYKTLDTCCPNHTSIPHARYVYFLMFVITIKYYNKKQPSTQVNRRTPLNHFTSQHGAHSKLMDPSRQDYHLHFKTS